MQRECHRRRNPATSLPGHAGLPRIPDLPIGGTPPDLPQRASKMKPFSQALLPLSLPLLAALLLSSPAAAQRRPAQSASGPGVVSRVTWNEDGKTVSFDNAGKRYELDLATLTRKEAAAAAPRATGRTPGRRPRRADSSGASMGKYVGRPSRGRQYTRVDSPDGKWQAHYKDWNVVLKNGAGDEVAVTTSGNADVHFGTASWVYGEELNQTKSMWWTPDSKKLIFYGFDDRGVQPFHLLRGWSEINTKQYPEFYPKAGAKNPAAELLIYDVASKTTVGVDVGGSSEEYLYGLRASPDGSVIMVNWTDRLQQHLKVLAIDVNTGTTRLIVEEKQDTWQSNSPPMRFLADQKRFLWPTDKSGFTHYELRDLDGKLHNTVTKGAFQTAGIQFVDEKKGLIGFTRASRCRPMASGSSRATSKSTRHRARPSTARISLTPISLTPRMARPPSRSRKARRKARAWPRCSSSVRATTSLTSTACSTSRRTSTRARATR